jgi:hypothetical protein
LPVSEFRYQYARARHLRREAEDLVPRGKLRDFVAGARAAF